jgi:hypothetical protein
MYELNRCLMKPEQIRELRLAHPFRPFNLVLRDGRRLPVDKPYYLGMDPLCRLFVHSSVGGGFERIAPEAVVDVDFDDPAALRRQISSSSGGQK